MEKIKQFKDLVSGDKICEWHSGAKNGKSIIKTYIIDRVEKFPDSQSPCDKFFNIYFKNEYGNLVIKALVESDYYSTNPENETVLFSESSKKILIPILNFGILMGGRYCFNRIKELENDLGIEFGIGRI